MRNLVKHISLVVIAILLTACVAEQRDRRIIAPPEKTVSIYDNGTIFKAGFNERPLYEEKRARNVGDGLIMTVAENPQAKKPATKDSKEGKDGKDAKEGKDGRDGEQKSRRQERDEELSNISADALVGEISMIVMEVMDNGYLYVAGGKQTKVEEEDKFVRVSGVVDPRNITDGNTVSSKFVSDVRIMVDEVRIRSDGTAINFSEGQNTFGNNFQSMAR